MLPCRRFADVLADARARLGADVGHYSFIAVDFHHILLAGLPAHSLALPPAHSRGHLYVTSYTEGFSHLVALVHATTGRVFGDTKFRKGASHEEQNLPISVGYSARLDGSDA
jgi:hypothetical protein